MRVENFSDAKSELRLLARRLRAEHARDETRDFTASLLARPGFREAKTVAVFLPLPGEPDAVAVCALCHETGKRVAVPAWDAKSRSYFFCELRPGAALAESNFGVREPAGKIAVPTAEIDLFLVPGLLFDSDGNRLGHGRGFYDRLLAPRRADALVWALAFDWQISAAKLPAEPHDVKMDAVIRC